MKDKENLYQHKQIQSMKDIGEMENCMEVGK